MRSLRFDSRSISLTHAANLETLDIKVGDYANPPPLSTSSSPTLENLSLMEDKTDLISQPTRASPPHTRSMNLRSAIYVTAREVRNGILDNEEGLEDENDVTTDTDNNSEPDFDDSNDDVFDSILGADYDIADDYMDID